MAGQSCTVPESNAHQHATKSTMALVCAIHCVQRNARGDDALNTGVIGRVEEQDSSLHGAFLLRVSFKSKIQSCSGKERKNSTKQRWGEAAYQMAPPLCAQNTTVQENRISTQHSPALTKSGWGIHHQSWLLPAAAEIVALRSKKCAMVRAILQ